MSLLISKILETLLLSNISKYFVSSDNQFGFKKNLACSRAIFSVRSTVDYFDNRNSTVNICSLDVAKAFDRTISHFTLFLQLMKKSVPVNIVIMLASWHMNSWELSTGMVHSLFQLSPQCWSETRWGNFTRHICQLRGWDNQCHPN